MFMWSSLYEHVHVHVPYSLITTTSDHKLNMKCEGQIPGMEAYDIELQQRLKALYVLF